MCLPAVHSVPGPYAPRDPAPRRAYEVERTTQERNWAKTVLPNTGQLALRYHCDVRALEEAGDRSKFGILGVMLPDLAQLRDLSVA